MGFDRKTLSHFIFLSVEKGGSLLRKAVTLALAIALLVVGIAAFKYFKPGDEAFAATPNPEERLELALQANKPIFIEFYADRCPACVAMKPIIMELKKQYGKDIEFILADTDGTGVGLAVDYQIMYIPAYVFIDANGERIGGEQSGFMPKGKLEGFLKELL